jgi:hypothetical protein
MRRTPTELENERERRRTYLDKLIIRRPGSETEGADPRAVSRALLSQVYKPAGACVARHAVNAVHREAAVAAARQQLRAARAPLSRA